MEIEPYKISEIKIALEEQKSILSKLYFRAVGKEDLEKFSKTIERIEKAVRPYDQFHDSPSYP